MTKSEYPEEPTSKGVGFLPTLEYFQKTYGSTMDGADQKAIGVFKSYESQEKLRRLQNELVWVKEGKASTAACDRVIGKKRKAKYRSYEHWAELMLLWLAAHKR